MASNKIFLGLVSFSTLLLIILRFYILNIKTKKLTHNFSIYFNYTVYSMIICNLGYILVVSSKEFFDIKNIWYEYVVYLGLTCCAYFFLMFCISYSKQSKELKKHYKIMVFLPQGLTNLILWTNSLHGYFYKNYYVENGFSFGSYFTIAIILIWGYIFIGIFLLFLFSKKTGKFALSQTKWLIYGSIIPLVFNGSWLIGNNYTNIYLKFGSNYDLTPISFTISIACFAYAIFKNKFLNLVPIPKEIVVNNMSDCYIIINDNFEIIEFNEPFKSKFGKLFDFDIGDSIIDVLNQKENLIFDITNFKDIVKEIKPNIRAKPYERNIILDGFNEWYDIEFARSDNKFNSIIIMLFKNITEHKSRIEQREQHQKVLARQDRLATLGQLAGGMAHDIKNPISAIRDGKDMLYILINRLINADTPIEKRKEDIDNTYIILNEISECCESVFSIVGSVRDHMRNVSIRDISKFSIEKLVNNIQILTEHIVKKAKCVLDIDFEPIDIYTDFGKLSQVLTNLTINAVQAYGKNEGTIKMSFSRKEDNLYIYVKDFAGGIPEHIKGSIFKEMLTTKGTEGTGLGLYMCYSLITAHLGGEIRFESEKETGTTFYIIIPLELKI